MIEKAPLHPLQLARSQADLHFRAPGPRTDQVAQFTAAKALRAFSPPSSLHPRLDCSLSVICPVTLTSSVVVAAKKLTLSKKRKGTDRNLYRYSRTGTFGRKNTLFLSCYTQQMLAPADSNQQLSSHTTFTQNKPSVNHLKMKTHSGLTFSPSFVDGPGRDSVHHTQQEKAERADPRHLLDVTGVSCGLKIEIHVGSLELASHSGPLHWETWETRMSLYLDPAEANKHMGDGYLLIS